MKTLFRKRPTKDTLDSIFNSLADEKTKYFVCTVTNPETHNPMVYMERLENSDYALCRVFLSKLDVQMYAGIVSSVQEYEETAIKYIEVGLDTLIDLANKVVVSRGTDIQKVRLSISAISDTDELEEISILWDSQPN